MSSKVQYAVDNSEKVIKAATSQVQRMEKYLSIDLSTSLNTSEITSWLSDKLQVFAGSTFNSAIAIFLMYFLLFFMLVHMHKFRDALIEYIPIKDGNLDVIGSDASNKIKANALGIPLVAIGQGVVALIGFLIFGIEDPYFWGAVVTVGSMIPFVGSALGIVPVFLLTLTSGETFSAWGILIYGAIVVSATDNLLRLVVLKHLDNIHPLITLIGVLVGLPLFGFIGLIFGPIVVSMFLVILRIYKEEYMRSG